MAQFGRPDSDITVTSCNGSPINTAGNRYQNIDEATAVDSDYVNGFSFSTFVYECGLSDVTDPGVHTGHIVRFRLAAQSGTNNLTFRLYQGTTLIASKTAAYSTAATDDSFTLTEGEAGNITDYTNLRIRMIPASGDGYEPSDTFLYWAELEVPDAAVAAIFPPPRQARYTAVGRASSY